MKILVTILMIVSMSNTAWRNVELSPMQDYWMHSGLSVIEEDGNCHIDNGQYYDTLDTINFYGTRL